MGKLNSIHRAQNHSRREQEVEVFSLQVGRRRLRGRLAPWLAACSAMTFVSSYLVPALSLPNDFVGKYEILDSRVLSISSGSTYVIQEGRLVAELSRNQSRPYCRALQSFFDEPQGSIDVRFSATADGAERAILKSIPAKTEARPATIECYAEQGFVGHLDLKIALGQIVTIDK